MMKKEPNTAAVKQPKKPRTPAQRRRRRKAVILIVFAALLVFAALYLLVLRHVDWTAAAESIRALFAEEDLSTEFIFRTPDYKEDIFTDTEYMALDRNLKFTYQGVTYTITDENYSRHGADVEFFGEYFACAISGDAEGYNALFSDKYYEKNDPKELFTPQKIYEMEIEKQSEKTEDGVTTYYYVVNYKIRLNNGTLRRDVGEDGSRPLAMVLTDRGGSIKIDQVLSYKYVDQALQ